MRSGPPQSGNEVLCPLVPVQGVKVGGTSFVFQAPELVERTHPNRATVDAETHAAVECPLENRNTPINPSADQKQLACLIRRKCQADVLFFQPTEKAP